jgi:hypothetical protein
MSTTHLKLAQEFAAKCSKRGIYVVGTLPDGAAGAGPIRVQLSAAHTRAHLDKAIAAFIQRSGPRAGSAERKKKSLERFRRQCHGGLCRPRPQLGSPGRDGQEIRATGSANHINFEQF